MFNNLIDIDFDTLLANTVPFEDLKLDDDDLYVPSSHPTSSSSSSSPFPTDFVIFSQNAHRRNTTVHTILSIASSMCPPADLILIQEPYYGKIGTNPRTAQGNPIFDVHGCPKHRDWQAIVPPYSSPDHVPDVIAYVPSRRSAWTFQLRLDIVLHQGLMCLEINSTSHPFLIFNMYNDVDNGAYHTIAALPTFPERAIFTRDFNLHHPVWSRDDNLDKHDARADWIAEVFTSNGYNILNTRGEDTFSVYRTLPGRRAELYTSTLDLAWASSTLQPFVQDFAVTRHLCNGLDHFPLIIRLSYAPSQSKVKFAFTDEKQTDWTTSFLRELSCRPPIPESILSEDEFLTSVDTLQSATLAASHDACLRKEKGPRAAKWFDSKVREALREVCQVRNRLQARKDRHNAIRFSMARERFNYQVVVAKRSHAHTFATSVKPGSDLWRLTSWYLGVRKTTVPTLKDPSSSPKFPIWVSSSLDKAKLLAESWFPNNAPKAEDIPHHFPPKPT